MADRQLPYAAIIYYDFVSKYSIFWIIIVTRIPVCVNSEDGRIRYLTLACTVCYGDSVYFLRELACIYKD